MAEEIKKTPLMEEYEKETERKAIWRGRITKGFKKWKKKPVKKGRKKSKTEFKGREKKETKLADVYVVKNSRGQFMREYTIEDHGEKRKELAEQFAKKINGEVIKK